MQKIGPRDRVWGGTVGLVTSLTGIGAAHAQDGASSSGGRELQTVVVSGQRSSLDVLPANILDTPQTIDVVNSELIRQQGAATLADALKNVPGITLNAGEGGTHGDLVNLRGFSAGDDYFMDGLRDTGVYDRDTFDYEAVEIYKGPASTLFGRGSTGGVINQVLKSAKLTPVDDFALTGGTNSEVRMTADLDQPIADHAAARLNLMGPRNHTDGRPFALTQRWGAAPALGFGIDTATTVTLKYLHQQEDNMPDYGLPFIFDRPVPVPRDTFYGLPDDDRFKTRVDVITGRVQHLFNNNWSVSDTARYGNYWFLSRQTAAIDGSANCFPTATTSGYFPGAPLCASLAASAQVPVAANNPYFPAIGTPLDAIEVLRDRPSSSGTIRTAMNDLGITGRFSSGPLDHTLVFGLEYDDESADLTRYVNQDTVIAPVPVLAPDAFEPFPGTQTTVSQLPNTQTHTVGVYADDMITLGAHWRLTGAIRYDSFHAHYDQPLGKASHFDHTDDIWSPRAALVYKPNERLSTYFSYGTSFDPSAENLALSASNQALPPEKDRTFEVGMKADILQKALTVTAALFDTEMTNARISDPLQPTLQTLAGTERVQGLEIGVQGYLTERWEVLAGYTYLDSWAIGLAGPGIRGPIPNTAHNQGNLWTTYEFDHGLTLGTGFNYIGQRLAGTDTQFIPGVISVASVPGYVTWDALASYRLTHSLSLQLNGYNLTDRYYFMNSYFTRPNENHTVPGPGRTVLLTARLSL
jgi:catecholate siderophore receptor